MAISLTLRGLADATTNAAAAIISIGHCNVELRVILDLRHPLVVPSKILKSDDFPSAEHIQAFLDVKRSVFWTVSIGSAHDSVLGSPRRFTGRFPKFGQSGILSALQIRFVRRIIWRGLLRMCCGRWALIWRIGWWK